MALSERLDIAASHVTVRRIGINDLIDAIKEGIDDFKAKPTTHIPFIAVIYPLATLFAFLIVFRYETLPLAFPIISGSLLIGPVVTICLYEMSRRRERGMDISGLQVFNFLQSRAIWDIVFLAAMLVAIFFLWLASAMTLFNMTLGDHWGQLPTSSLSFSEFVRQLFMTPEGWTLIVMGNLIGLVFAVVVLSLSVVSFPMLLDKEVSLATAIQTSARVVTTNPMIMAGWGVFVVVALAVGAAPALVGLAVVSPVLGHASYHLYKKAVV